MHYRQPPRPQTNNAAATTVDKAAVAAAAAAADVQARSQWSSFNKLHLLKSLIFLSHGLGIYSSRTSFLEIEL